jgi:hypothetical protein
MRQARRAVVLLQARAISPDVAARKYRDLSMGQPHRQTSLLRYSESPDWSTGKPDFDNPKVGVNSRLFDDFDLDAVPVVVIDGKNLW